MNYRKAFTRITLIAWSTLALIFFLWSIVPQKAEADSLFKPALNYGAGDEPASVAIEDLNRDGNPDLAVANSNSDNVSVLLGNGDGTFQSAVNYDAGTGLGPSSIAIGDLNGDGNPDLVVANYWDHNVSVLLGNGDGTFQSAVNYDAGTGLRPSSIAIGDLNGDGNPDLVVANTYGTDGISVVSVLLGNGDGTFKSALNYGAGGGDSSVAIGDLNRDGNPDLAVASYGYGPALRMVVVLLGNGDGTFQSAVTYDIDGLPRDVAIGDLNGDGELDLAVANRGSWFSNVPGTVSVLLGNGGGTFQSAVNYDTGYWSSSVAIGDFNKDTSLDLAVANKDSDNVSVLINTGDSIFIDIYPGYWAEVAIYKIFNAGITKGCSTNPLKYCPQDDVTRAQMAVFLDRGIHGSSFSPPPATGIFDDVPIGSFAANWIEQFYKDGITGGCGTTPLQYCALSPVTRAQMAVFLLRAKHGSNYIPPAATGIFDDVPVGSFAADWIEELYNEGITGGCGTSPLRYCPSSPVTRAQMAVFIVRTFGL